jgi:pimeloyl-ACP methyl ester carboxylesterase
VDRALLVGWSYGAVVAAHWANRNPDRALGAVWTRLSCAAPRSLGSKSAGSSDDVPSSSLLLS